MHWSFLQVCVRRSQSPEDRQKITRRSPLEVYRHLSVSEVHYHRLHLIWITTYTHAYEKLGRAAIPNDTLQVLHKKELCLPSRETLLWTASLPVNSFSQAVPGVSVDGYLFPQKQCVDLTAKMRLGWVLEAAQDTHFRAVPLLVNSISDPVVGGGQNFFLWRTCMLHSSR